MPLPSNAKKSLRQYRKICANFTRASPSATMARLWPKLATGSAAAAECASCHTFFRNWLRKPTKKFSAAKAAASYFNPGTDSGREFRGWFRKYILGGFDKFLMPRRPPTSRGKDLFADSPAEPKPAAAAHRANIDGGSRGNPGPAAYGVVIRDGRGEIVAKLKKYIGRMTNNVAEYYGLIAAMDYAQSHAIRALRIEKIGRASCRERVY